MSEVPRPSHADFTYQAKYGIKAASGGASNELGRVAAGAVAEKWLKVRFGIDVVAFVSSVGNIEADRSKIDYASLNRETVDQNIVRCPDVEAAEKMIAAKEAQDSIGGTVTCICRNIPVGLGEPCFDKIEALLAHAMLSIPATKGFEVGSGFEGTKLHGSQHNDPYCIRESGKLGTVTNNSGGIQGGITNGEDIVFRVAFKPPATIGQNQKTATYLGTPAELEARGRHDPCIVNRAIPIVEAMAALVIADCCMMQLARQAAHGPIEGSDISLQFANLYKL